MKKIVVIGATGMLGKPVTEELISAGHLVSILSRSPDKARSLFPDADVISGDLEDPNSLADAFTGHDAVYLSLSTAPNEKHKTFKTEIDGVMNVIYAAKKTGIQRIGYLSSMIQGYDGFDWWMFDIKRNACELLKSVDISSTIFYPSNFFENFTGVMRMGSRIILAGHQKTTCWWISAQDYGRMVSVALESDEGDQEYTIQGLEPFNFDDAADVFIANYSAAKLKKTRAPMWVLKMAGMISSQANFGWHINEAINKYDEPFEGEQAWDKLGKPQMTLAEFARKASSRSE